MKVLRWNRVRGIMIFGVISGVAAILSSSSCGAPPGDGPGLYDGAWDCVGYSHTHKDSNGDWDPCCERSICCPNPLLDHYSVVDGSDPPSTTWDPCCKVGPCDGHNPWLPKDLPAPDGGTNSDASACNDSCSGECLPRAMPPFWGPLLFSTSPVGQEQPCPTGSIPVLTNHYTELTVSPLACPDCACDPPTGECGLPGAMTAHSGSCEGDGPGAVHTDFSPPSDWDGACSGQGAIPAGAQCNGKLCVRSLSVAPLTLKTSGCAPRAKSPLPTPEPPHWQTAATLCQPSACGGGSGACVTQPGSGGASWGVCLATSVSDIACPSAYAARHVIYDSFNDSRSCSACSCEPPSGGQCISGLAVYPGPACGGSTTLTGGITALGKPFCFDLPPGAALGSMKMTPPQFVGGSCEPRGGVSQGEVTKQGALTLCCSA